MKKIRIPRKEKKAFKKKVEAISGVHLKRMNQYFMAALERSKRCDAGVEIFKPVSVSMNNGLISWEENLFGGRKPEFKTRIIYSDEFGIKLPPPEHPLIATV